MRNIIQFHKKFLGKIIVVLTFSCFLSGCHTENEPATIAQAAAKKEKADRVAEDVLPGITEAQRKTIAENDIERKQNKSGPFPKRDKTNNYTTAERDPFALPAEMQKPKNIPAVNNKMAPTQTVPSYTSDPCVAGIFDNGKEKFALVRWQQIQGIFRCGEHLGNGYFVKEITANSVLLCPEQNRPGTDTVTLTLH